MFLSIPRHQKISGIVGWLIMAGFLTVSMGCGQFSRADAESKAQVAPSEEAAAVNLAVAREGTVREAREFTGTTQPFRLVSLRSQAEGQLLDLYVTVGDTVTQGQVLAQVDRSVLASNVVEAQAEVAARQSEVAQARINVSDAQTQVEQARIELQQAQSDLERLQFLLNQGAVPAQQVEQAQTRVRIARQVVQSAQEQVRTRQQAVIAAEGRVTAQRAVVGREQERESFARLTSPVTGSVVEQPTEPGNLVQPGTEVLKLGDFSQVKVAVQISELELGGIRPGQSVQVRLDAFPKQTLKGRVTRISPAADPVARLVPVEVTIPNSQGQIGSGLLARVTFTQTTSRPRVLVPETALSTNEDRRSGQQGNRSSNQPEGQERKPSSLGTLFVVNDSGNEARVTARQVTLGNRGNGQVEVIAGLQVGERYVARSSKALKNGDPVKPSILSEQQGQK